MANQLQKYFPSIRTRNQVLQDITSNPTLAEDFASFTREQQDNFLDICTGARGVPILYDNFFQAVLNPDIYPDRIQDLIGCILGKKVVHIKSLGRSSFSLGDEKSLVILDLVVKIEDGSYINLEVQKIGYAFPGQRAACYSSDLMVRQYSAVKEEIEKQKADFPNLRFKYRMLRPVYTIVLIEKSTQEFEEFPDEYFHVFSQKSNTGLHLELLMNYIFIPLDIFKKKSQNIDKMSDLDEWLTFFCMDDPDKIIALCEKSPKFKPLYEHMYEICQNTERMMGMYSTILKKLDEDTVDYMIDELQGRVERLNSDLSDTNKRLDAANKKLDAANEQIAKKNAYIKELEARLASM